MEEYSKLEYTSRLRDASDLVHDIHLTFMASLLGASLRGTSYLIGLQLISRVLTFGLNTLILRYTSPSVFGFATIQLELLLNTILFLCREGFRLAVQRLPTASDKKAQQQIQQEIINLSSIPVVLGLFMSTGTIGIFLVYAPEESLSIPYFRRTVNASYSVATETIVTTKTTVNVDDAAIHAIPAGKSRFSFEKVRKKLKTSKFIKQRQAVYGGAPVLSPTTSRERPDTFIALQYRFGEPECISQRREQPVLPRRDNKSQAASPSKNAFPSRRPYPLSKHHSTSSIVTISLHPWESPPEERPPSQTWPPVLLERLLYRFHRFSTAAYGQVFLQLLGFSDPSHWASHHFVRDLNDHENHAAFAAHVGCSTADILFSSYAPGNTTRASPSIVYFVSVDHQSQSVVVSLRGTLGFSDLLTDLTAEYHPYTRRSTRDQPEQHFVHKGVLEAAQRLAGNTALLACIKTALRERPNFGLVLTGHSLGGSVAALLALEWSLPAQQVSGDIQVPGYAHYLQLPGLPTVPISSFGYGTPACLSPSLCCATAGLIVTCVNGFDVIPSLSFGLVRDFKSISQVLSQDESGVLAGIGKRLISGAGTGKQASAADDDYLFAVLKTLRCQMDHDKLVPPGRLLTIQTSLHRCHVPSTGHATQGTRVVVSEVVDVQSRFGEMMFAKTMLSDHSPVAYEASLQALVRGLAEQSEKEQEGDGTLDGE